MKAHRWDNETVTLRLSLEEAETLKHMMTFDTTIPNALRGSTQQASAVDRIEALIPDVWQTLDQAGVEDSLGSY